MAYNDLSDLFASSPISYLITPSVPSAQVIGVSILYLQNKRHNTSLLLLPLATLFLFNSFHDWVNNIIQVSIQMLHPHRDPM